MRDSEEVEIRVQFLVAPPILLHLGMNEHPGRGYAGVSSAGVEDSVIRCASSGLRLGNWCYVSKAYNPINKLT